MDLANDAFKGKIASNITSMVKWGTVGIALVGLGFAITVIVMTEDFDKAISVLQYVFGALLPLWGTWIGTVLAYYFTRENFEAANKNVQQLVDKITSDKKLQSILAKDVMIPLENLTYQEMKTSETWTKFKLKDDCLDFVTAKGIKRVILLDEQKCARAVIHRDLISFFMANIALSGKPVTGLTLQDMHQIGDAEIKNTMDNCVRFINEKATLFDAKQLMDQVKTCRDVFITSTGSPKEKVLGWITDVTITQNAIV